VRDKEDLLRQLLNDYADQIPRARLPRDPHERIITASTVMHDSLAARPWITEVLTADDLVGTSSLWMVEAIVAGAIDSGCTPEQAVVLYRSVWYYTVGEILVRATAAHRRAESSRPVYRDAVLLGLDKSELPHLAALADRWPSLTARDTYQHGLHAIVDGLLPSTVTPS